MNVKRAELTPRPNCAHQFFKASTSIRKWAEDEFSPVDRYNPATRKMERRVVHAVL